MSWAGESGLTRLPPNASSILAASSASRGGLPPAGTAGGRGPSNPASSESCTSVRHGSPAKLISAATRPPADSAATSMPNRAG